MSEQLKKEKEKRAEKRKIKSLQERPIEGGKMEEGQSLLDLGGAEGEDLFNRTVPTGGGRYLADGITLTLDEWKRRTGESDVGYTNSYKMRVPTSCDRQGNPLAEDGSLALDGVDDVGEIADGDFTAPTRNVRLPALPKNVDAAIGANGRPVVIKRNIFERNFAKHGDVTPAQSREILKAALYSPDLYGQNQKTSRPHNWVVINIPSDNGKNRLVLLEVNHGKDNVEVVHWHYTDDKGLEKIKKQAAREDGQLLMLPSVSTKEAGALSGPTSGLTGKNVPQAAAGVKTDDGLEVPHFFFLACEALRGVAPFLADFEKVVAFPVRPSV